MPSPKSLPKLIIIRGPSGAGKNMVAKALKQAVKVKVASIDQDYYRTNMLTWSDEEAPVTAKEMLFSDIRIALSHNFSVIADGIFTAESYKKYFDELFVEIKAEIYIFWFDLSLEETFKRHKTRQKTLDFGEEDMRD